MLTGLPVTELNLDNTSISDAGLSSLRDLPLLKSLDLAGDEDSPLSDLGLAQLRGLPLAALRLGGWYRATPDGMHALQGMPLTNLQLVGLEYFHEVGLGVLSGMLSLTSLDLSYTVGVRSLAVLQGLPSHVLEPAGSL